MDKKPEKTDKFVTMIGFAKRAGKIVYGYDNLKSSRSVKLLAVSDTASENLIRSMQTLSAKKAVPLISAHELESKVGNNVKALGITDGNMANAALRFAKENENGYRVETDKQEVTEVVDG